MVSLRAEAERDKFDQAVISALAGHGGEARAETIRDVVRGTAAQVRASLERWMAEKSVKKKGQRRA